MSKLKAGYLALAFFASFSPVGLASSQSAPPAQAVTYDQGAMQARMRQKFANMQAVHEGMLLGDWAMMERALVELMELAKSSAWSNIRTNGYNRATGRFYDAAEDLLGAVKSKDANGAILPYLRLTTSCLECHRDVRAKLGGGK